MIKIKQAFGDDKSFSWPSDQINEVKAVSLASFPEVKTMIYYDNRRHWFYSTESAEEINNKIKECGHATAVN